MTTSFLVLGDQLSTDVRPWDTMDTDTVIVLIEADNLCRAPRHRIKVGLYLAAMRAFARHVSALGFRVDYRRASTLADGLAAHRADFSPTRVLMNEPRGRRATALFTRLGVEILPSPFFLTPASEVSFDPARPPTMEKFYRSQRRRLGILMEGEEPVGGRWNFDTDNRQPLPRDGGSWPSPWFAPLSDEEEEIMAALPPDLPGGDGLQWWPRTREHARDQLAHALTKIAPHFGPHEDAASTSNWHLAHTRLSVAMNLGLLHPGEVVAGIVDAYDQGHLPLASAEGLLRQIIGWREWMWLLHRLRPSSYADLNFFEATEPIPASWTSMGSHDMVCLGTALGHLRDYGWMHHIERLMVLGNAATVSGLSPRDVARWMEVSFVDGAEWVMEGNVVGMAMYADHGQTATKPYIAGGNYLSRMTNFCHQCDFRPSHRTGDDACPLTTLYWDFLVRHHDRLRSNHRLAPMLSAARRRDDLAAIQSRASEARAVVIRGTTSR